MVYNFNKGGFRHREWTERFRQPNLKLSFFNASNRGGFLAIAGDAAKRRGQNSPYLAVPKKSEMKNVVWVTLACGFYRVRQMARP